MQNSAEQIIANGTNIPDHMTKLREEVELMILRHIS